MTYRQAIFLVAAEEVERAKAWEWSVYCSPKLPRSALKKAKLETAAAHMRARRLLESGSQRLPSVLRAAIEAKMRNQVTPDTLATCAGFVAS